MVELGLLQTKMVEFISVHEASDIKYVLFSTAVWNFWTNFGSQCGMRRIYVFEKKPWNFQVCHFQRFQTFRIFRDYPEIKHHVLRSRNKIYLSRIKTFSSTFEENPKFLLFHSPNLFVYKLASSSIASSTIFKYLKSQWWCLLKKSSSSVLLYLGNLIPRPYGFKSRACTKILIIYKNRFQYIHGDIILNMVHHKKRKTKCWLNGCSCEEKFAPCVGKFSGNFSGKISVG